MAVPHNVPPGGRIVNFQTQTNRLGLVYHQPGCYHVYHMYNYRVMTWEDASQGRSACLHCHHGSMKHLLCTPCLHRGVRRNLIPTGAPEGADLVYTCPTCGHIVFQGEADA